MFTVFKLFVDMTVCVFSLGIQASNRPSHSNARIWSNYRILSLCLL